MVNEIFITDATVGKLTKWLRFIGYDTICDKNESLHSNFKKAIAEKRIFITRNTKVQQLLVRAKKEIGPVPTVVVIRYNTIVDQMNQLVSIIPIKTTSVFLSRCSRCNTLLTSLTREKIHGLVPDYIASRYNSFLFCSTCKRVYWPGTHVNKLVALLNHLSPSR